MNILSIEDLEKTMDSVPLFSGVFLGLEDNDKTGIVGKNGSGKSTLLKCITGALVPDKGTVAVKNGLTIACLAQTVTFQPGATVASYLFEDRSEKIQLLKRLRKGDTSLLDRAEKDGLWDIEREYYAVMEKLQANASPDRLMSSLSGGEQKKVALSRALAVKPGLLLLDEPTNHLDIPSIEYLEKWIQSSRNAVLIVTHDRRLLNECCDTIWELDKGSVYRHPGSYSAYLERREERYRMDEKEMERLRTILRRERKWLLRGPQARTGKDKNRKDRIDQMESSLHKVRDDAQNSFRTLERRQGKKVLDLWDVSKGYDGRTLFSGFTFSFLKGQKIGLIGKNGSGKSTLMNLIAGLENPDSGTIDKGVNTVYGYYDQLGRDLNSDKTILEYASSIAERIRLSDKEELSTSMFLKLFGFSEERQRVVIKTLSGGERRRLYLVTRLLGAPNFLLFDEPTNDLDIETMENLESFLTSFPGTVLISSHDRTFLDITADMLLVIEDGKITLFPGSYDEWKAAKEAEKPSKAQLEKPIPAQRPHEKKGLSYREQKEKEALEAAISKLEDLIKQLEDSFSDAKTTELGTLSERTKLYESSQTELETKTERWFELEEKESGN